MGGQTLFDKIWSRHVICELPDGGSLLHVDRHFIHDIEAGPRLRRIRENGYAVRRPDLTFAVPDHVVASSPGRSTDTNPTGGRLLRDMRRFTADEGIRMFDLGQTGQGIVHIIGPELGLTIPGALIVCGDSHTCTHGGLGALAFGIGSSEAEHVLATQTIRQAKPRTLRLTFDGPLASGVTAKDLILYAIGRFGTAAGRGYAVEYAGSTVRALEIEQRLTLCNLSIEMGAKIGMIAPDEKSFEYVRGRPYAPPGALFEQAVERWRALSSDVDAQFDLELNVDSTAVTPQITWGTSPEHVVAVSGRVPDPAAEADPQRRAALEDALRYMGLQALQPIAGVRIDRVFIGSCANSRLSDLQEAARLVQGRSVAPHVVAWVVPGSVETQRAAEAEGLDRIFLDAGFEWREPSCSMCLAANGDIVAPGERSVSTSNRNFVGRQGPGARTHLASPAMAAAAAIAGEICDARALGALL
jgi:3-isopropylmalate/(R)-2-methylmalate dehydratase large subunit